MILATLCYVRSNGKTLMLHRIRKPDDIHAGKWNGLGGKFMPGESPEECVTREVYEESGLQIQDPVLRGHLTFPRFSGQRDWYVFVFVATRFSGTLIDSAEGILRWIDNDRILELELWPGDRIFWDWLWEERFFSGKFEYVEGTLAAHSVAFYGG